MKRNNRGAVEFKDRGRKEKNYPFDNPIVFWYCSVGRVFADNGTGIIAYKFESNPHKAKDITKGIINLDPNNYSEEESKDLLSRFDFKSNCFGYAFCGDEFWIDPIEDDMHKNLDTIDLILENDGYERIERPIANSIALFRDEIRYQ